MQNIYCTRHVTDSTRTVAGCHCWSVPLEHFPGPCPQSELRQSCFQARVKDHFGEEGELPVMRYTNLHFYFDTGTESIVQHAAYPCCLTLEQNATAKE